MKTDLENKAEQLIVRYLADTCTLQERQLVERVYSKAALTKIVKDKDVDFTRIGKESWAFIAAATKDTKAAPAKLWPRYWGIAAAAIAVITLGIWLYEVGFSGSPKELAEGLGSTRYTNDIAPGKNMATLIDNQGKMITLSDAKTGVIFNNNKLTYNDGSLVQNSSGSHFSGSAKSDQKNTGPVGAPSLGVTKILTLATPKGGTYSIILQDGTRVWLNADSKLEFLSDYRDKAQRIVKLIGEGYFEVARDAKRPFIVESTGQRVTVLGTHFNISAYKGEETRTTLLEGSVRISDDVGVRDDVILKPNQQSFFTGSKGITVREVDASQTIAWKNGLFQFKDADVETVMRQIARWYNIEVIYENGIPKGKITGKVYRNMNASKVLEVLKGLDITFKIERNKIIVMQ